jgi:hypothetical protein
MIFFHVRIKKTEVEYLQKWRTQYLICIVGLPPLLPGVEVSCPKTINIKQYLNTNNFSSNLHKQHNYILQKYFINNSVVISHKKSFFVTNLFKINIFWFSSITRLKSHPKRHFQYFIFFILDDIPNVSFEEFNIW